VKAAKRREEEAVRRETEKGLKAFREQRQTVGSGAVAEDEAAGASNAVDTQAEGNDQWAAAGRKRKRAKGKARDVKGVRRKVSDGPEMVAEVDGDENGGTGLERAEVRVKEEENKPKPAGESGIAEAASKPPGTSAKKGLVDYGSDDSDDE
jgi:hypothetical protein